VRSRLEYMREVERWIAWVRAGAVVFAVVEIGVFTEYHPPGYELWAWAITGVFAIGAAILLALSRREIAGTRTIAALALLFDTAIICAYGLLYSFEFGAPTRWALIFAVVEAALRYGILGGVLLPIALFPYLAFQEWWREREFGPPPPFLWDRVTLPFGILLLNGLIVGWLVARLRKEATAAQRRAGEAENLRDDLGRRVDILEAAGRCARALASSLDLDEAFSIFIRELRGLVPFDRTAIVLAEGNVANVVATAGRGKDTVLRPGTLRAIENSLIAEVLRGETIYREDMSDARYAEEELLLSLGLRSRVAAPLLAGSRAIGMISVVREEPRSFSRDEIELLSLLGRFVASAVQNIRSYEAERRTVEELRRLSALRADFVSLVSHELRSPMATVIGSARTLQARWRELTPEQRESFLALIADETSRLASLVGDVLDTSRIEAGTFTYTFDDVDLDALVHDVVSVLGIGQDEVALRAQISESLPTIRGDRERLRQVLANLIENAVKYSPADEIVDVLATASNGRVHVSVTDRGPGIPVEDQGLIFEKFGRARSGKAVPGTGLGLFIARSIAEAHGGSLDVQSIPAHGATFTLTLPGRSDDRPA
jgi:signal transduction histidine kinase